jgi:hypothetical protein
MKAHLTRVEKIKFIKGVMAGEVKRPTAQDDCSLFIKDDKVLFYKTTAGAVDLSHPINEADFINLHPELIISHKLIFEDFSHCKEQSKTIKDAI